jgi:hypothetical protein
MCTSLISSLHHTATVLAVNAGMMKMLRVRRWPVEMKGERRDET